MAFGKNPEDLKNVPAFNSNSGSMEQRAAYLRKMAEEQAKKAREGGKGSFYMREFKPSLDAPDYIRLVKGEYNYVYGSIEGGTPTTQTIVLEYLPFVQHYNSAIKKQSVCSAGPFHYSKKHRDPCKGCDRFFGDITRGPDGKTKKGPVSKRDMSAFTVVHMAFYHKVEQTDDSGDVKKNPETGVPYYNWERCEGRGCTYCRQNKEKVDGRTLPWAMGDSHKNILIEEGTQRVRSSCRGCGTKDSILSKEWSCAECGQTIIDMATTEMKDSEIKEVANKPVTCPTCKVTGFLIELIECSKCTKAERATIFDVNWKVKRTKAADGSEQTMLILVDFDAPSPIPERYQEMAKPLPLERVYAPTSMEYQEKVMAASSTQPSAGARPYKPR